MPASTFPALGLFKMPVVNIEPMKVERSIARAELRHLRTGLHLQEVNFVMKRKSLTAGAPGRLRLGQRQCHASIGHWSCAIVGSLRLHERVFTV